MEEPSAAAKLTAPTTDLEVHYRDRAPVALQSLRRMRWVADTIHDIPLPRRAALAEAIDGV